MLDDPALSDDARCPRCGAAFHCGMNAAAPCACTTVTLDADTLATLRGLYSGCLCLACLQALAAPGAQPSTTGRP